MDVDLCLTVLQVEDCSASQYCCFRYGINMIMLRMIFQFNKALNVTIYFCETTSMPGSF